MAKKKRVSKRERATGKNSSNDKKLFYLTIGVFLVCVLLLNFYGYDNPLNFTGKAISYPSMSNTKSTSFIGQLFNPWTEGNLDVSISKYFLLFILSIFIYSILSVGGFPPTEDEKTAGVLRWLMAIPVAFLAIAFITPDDLVGVLNTYSALGLTLTIFIPFALVILYTAGSVTKKRLKVADLLLPNFMWLLFALFLGYRTVRLFMEEGTQAGGTVMVISIIAFLIAVLITWKFKWFSKQVVGMSIQGKYLAAELEKAEEDIGSNKAEFRKFIEENTSGGMQKEALRKYGFK